MLSKNEWDPLKKVIVGSADNAKIPDLDVSLWTINYADKADSKDIPVGRYPDQVIEEANEDLEILCDFLTSEGVEVLRPKENFEHNYYTYCPRDNILVHDDLILACPQPLRARSKEYLAYEHHFNEYRGFLRYTVKEPNRHDNLYNTKCVTNKDVLALTEVEPSFDAANILRTPEDLYYLVSNGGNKAGAEYLQELVGPDIKVHTIENVYSYMHIDSTIAFVREGLMLLNPSRIKSIDQLPQSLRGWDYIWAPEPVDIGHYPGYCGASTWLNINLLTISPDLVVIEEHQHNLRHELEKYGIDCAMLPGRQQRTLGGGFHCVTLDIIRDHEN